MSQKLIDALHTHFKKHRIIFWYDENEAKRDLFASYQNSDVHKLEVQNNEFWLKYHILREKPGDKFLVYSPQARPEDESNWLLDLNLAHFVFATDEVALLLQELELGNQHAGFIREHVDFFANTAERLEPFKKQLGSQETKRSLSYAMLAVLCSRSLRQKSVRKDLMGLLPTLIENELIEDGLFYQNIQKYGVASFFWDEVATRFGYTSDHPSLKGFVLHLFQSALYFATGAESSAYAKEAFTFLDTWRSFTGSVKNYMQIAEMMEAELNIDHEIKQVDISILTGIDLFKSIDKRILGYLTTHAVDETIETEKALAIIRARRENFWYSNEAEGKLRDYYSALEAFFTYQYKRGVVESVKSRKLGKTELWKLYVEGLYELDTLHRRFLFHYNRTTADPNFHSLLEKMEKHYLNAFQFEVQRMWEQCYTSESLDPPSGIRRQSDFFDRYVSPYVDEDKVLFVLISDALRYEVGVELSTRLRRTNRFQVQLDSMQASIPSFTQLGMAALLPHVKLEIDAESGNVLVDDQKSAGVSQRQKILEHFFSKEYPQKTVKAMQADDFNHMSQEQQLQEINGVSLFFLFHNHIDAIGDNAKTEAGLPAAVEEEISFLTNLCRKITNLNRTHLLITADHGFLFQHKDIDESDSVSIKTMAHEFRRNRRFILGSKLTKKDGLTRIDGQALRLQSEIQVMVPQGLSRISVKGGGRRFVHGGISPQEIILPLITIRKTRNDDVGTVDVEVLKKGELISSGQVTIKFFQSQPVGPKMNPRTLLIRFEADEGQVLSNNVEAIFDNADKYEQNRGKSYSFTFNRDAERYNDRYITLKMYDKKEGGTLVFYNEYSYKYRTKMEKDFDL
ncbi:MAG: BREX-1 system phosphatase PglZ type A [Spirochaetia bacterium]|nr:BREX-1 system phosphatase PglZ type A [Spirochaetia bacterium]